MFHIAFELFLSLLFESSLDPQFLLFLDTVCIKPFDQLSQKNRPKHKLTPPVGTLPTSNCRKGFDDMHRQRMWLATTSVHCKCTRVHIGVVVYSVAMPTQIPSTYQGEVN